MKKILFGIFIGLFSISASFAVKISITVVDENDQPLVGVYVYRKDDTSVGGITDVEGKLNTYFKDDNATIVISYIGYQSQEFKASELVDKKIIMEPDAEVIKDVISLGFKPAGKKKVVYSRKSLLDDYKQKDVECIEPEYKRITKEKESRNNKGETVKDTTYECVLQPCDVQNGIGMYTEIDNLIKRDIKVEYETEDDKSEYRKETRTFNVPKVKCVIQSCNDGFHQVNDNCISDNYLSQIEEDAARLDKLASDLKINKWRNKEGHFNTMRLMSDMTAGIVLGTTGALITSKMVKKSQIEDGFEDLECTISGQTVAQFGDDFTVYIR